MINESEIVDAVASLDLNGNEDGLIPAFGVYLTQMFANYYNKISYRFEEEYAKVINDPEVQEASKFLLIEAGHVCGFNTFGGIMKSDEWDAVVKPMIESTEDWVRGMVACVNALGWGVWKIQELIPGEKLVIRIAESYESNYYLKKYGPNAKHGKCYLATGTISALMNLVYYGNIMDKPELTEEFYEKLFHGDEGFGCEEIKCRSKGDPFCEFVVTKGHRLRNFFT